MGMRHTFLLQLKAARRLAPPLPVTNTRPALRYHSLFRGSCSHDFSMISGQEIGVLRVPIDEVGDERAAWYDLQPLCANILQDGVHHLRADAAAAQRPRHFGVGDCHHAVGEAIEGERVAALDVELETMVRGVMTDGGHGSSFKNVRWRVAHRIARNGSPARIEG